MRVETFHKEEDDKENIQKINKSYQTAIVWRINRKGKQST
jgi:hypothetical protein